jgi:hypothetical protein
MHTGYPIVYRVTQAEFNAGLPVDAGGGFVEIVDANGQPTGPMYLTGAAGSIPVLINSTFFRTAAVPIGAFNIVYDIDGLTCGLASSNSPSTAEQILGMAINTASPGQPVQIIRQGVYLGNTGFTPGLLFLGIAGNITHGPATSGVHVQVGNTISSTVSDINIGVVIYL